jgi:hypothetical protein
MAVLRSQRAVLNAGCSMGRCGSDLSYAWHQVSGAETPLSNYEGANPSFTAPLDTGEIVFELRVSDVCGSSADRVTVRIVSSDYPPPPVASAGGDLGVPPGWSGRLDGSGSAPLSGSSVDYSWTATPPGMMAPGDTSAYPSILIPVSPGAGTAFLETRSNINWSAPDYAALIFDGKFSAPASIQTPALKDPEVYVLPGQKTAALDAMASTLSYDEFLWMQVHGSPLTISRPSSIQASVALPTTAGVFVFALKARKGRLWSAPAFKIIHVWGGQGYELPAARAGGDLSAKPGVNLQLNGAGSTVDPRRLAASSFKWEQTAGTPVTLDNPASSQPSFTAPSTPGRLGFSLTVGDGVVWSPPDTCIVTVGQ